MKRSIIFFCIAAIVYMCGLNLSAINRYISEEKKGIQKIEEKEKQAKKEEKKSTKKKVEEKKVAKSTEIEEEKEVKEEKETLKEVKTSGKYVDQSGDPYTNTVTVSNLNDIDILVNKYSGLPSDYTPSDLVTVSNSGEHNAQMRAPAAQAFEQMVAAASQQGFILNACSAFRSYDYQSGLYYNGVNGYGVEYADRYWTRPGFGEHQTGLAVDIRMDNDTSDLDAVRYNSHYPWLLKHMHEYGFILRYPDDKEDKTKIAPESWHLRYVGVDLATYLYENNLSLDEYYGA